MKAARIAMLVMAGALILAGPGRATTLRPMGLGELAKRADSITVARCIGAKTYFGGKNGRKILTDFQFSVREVVKGDHRDRLTLTLLGGRIDPVDMRVPGSPVFGVGDEVVLFTSRQGSGHRVLVGFSQGVFLVTTDLETGESYVGPRNFKGISFQGREPAASGRMPLEEFLDTVMDLQREPGGPVDIRTLRPERLPEGE